MATYTFLMRPLLPIGKKANPPRYWKTKVFPAALAFIASAIGGAQLQGHDLPQSEKLISGGEAVPARGSETSAGADGEAGISMAQESKQATPQVVVSPAGKLSGPSEMTGETDVVSTQGTVRSALKGLTPSLETATKRTTASSHQWKLQEPSRRILNTVGTPPGKCLVVCPTGAEASVVVCLCALVAFFPPPLSSPDPSKSSSSSTKHHLQQPSGPASPQSCCSAEADGPGVEPWLGGGGFSVLRRGAGAAAGVVTKAQIRWRFLLIQQECPWARPPRRLMQELNEYFMTPGQHSWWTLSYWLLGDSEDCDSSVALAGPDSRS